MKRYIPFLILLSVSIAFFYKMFFQFKMPFPGDLLVSEYSPFKFESYLGYNPGSIPNKAQYFDTIQQLYPWKIFAINEIKKGTFPLWNPYNFSGHPLFANGQAGVLNPFNLLFFIFDNKLGWSFYIYFQPLILSVFTYIYLKKIGTSKLSAIFGSVAFSYCLFMSVFLEYGNLGYSFIYLPLILFLIEKIIENKKTKLGLLLPLVIAFTFFSGHLQISGGVFLFSFAYLMVRTWKNAKKKNLIILISFMLLGVGISVVQLLPTFELIKYSARVSHDLSFFKDLLLLQLHQLILFITPDIYGNPATRNYLLKDAYPGNAIYIGILPFVFSIYSLLLIKKTFFIKFFSISSLILLFLITNNPISIFLFKLNIPFISSSSPSNFIYLLSFSLIVMATFGFDDYLKKYDKKIFWIIGSIPLLLLVFFIIHKILKIEIFQKQMIISLVIIFISLVTFILVYIKKSKLLAYSFIFILALDLGYYFLKFNPFVDSALVYPDTHLFKEISKYPLTKFWGYSNANIEPNLATELRIYSPEGYDPLYPSSYGKFLYMAKYGLLLRDFSDSTRSLAIINNGYGEKDLRENLYRQKILDESGVGIVLNRRENPTSEYTFDDKKYRKINEIDGWTIFRNINAKPFAYLTSGIAVYSTDKEFEEKFFTSRSLMLEEEPRFKIKKQESRGHIKVLYINSNKSEFEVDNDINSIFVILQNYFPGWKAYVDGKEEKILKANYTFSSIPLEKGKHAIAFIYQPTSFYWGLVITIISIVSIFFVYIRININKNE